MTSSLTRQAAKAYLIGVPSIDSCETEQEMDEAIRAACEEIRRRRPRPPVAPTICDVVPLQTLEPIERLSYRRELPS